MNRKTFLKTTAATLLATSVEGLQAKGFAATTPPSEGLQVRFLLAVPVLFFGCGFAE
jgi:hypothetical protein